MNKTLLNMLCALLLASASITPVNAFGIPSWMKNKKTLVFAGLVAAGAWWYIKKHTKHRFKITLGDGSVLCNEYTFKNHIQVKFCEVGQKDHSYIATCNNEGLLNVQTPPGLTIFTDNSSVISFAHDGRRLNQNISLECSKCYSYTITADDVVVANGTIGQTNASQKSNWLSQFSGWVSRIACR